MLTSERRENTFTPRARPWRTLRRCSKRLADSKGCHDMTNGVFLLLYFGGGSWAVWTYAPHIPWVIGLWLWSCCLMWALEMMRQECVKAYTRRIFEG
ncbi:hypothetical protein SAMN05519103_00710 [Rhizobiales bacterium GAS113]|nr:hypothetical protein SAMN05519103_00710 [Rhizobiales bacterium GAS113]